MIPTVSIVVPTHNRSALLAVHLAALRVQTMPRDQAEWIVVCDGCSDDSADVARDAGADHVIEQEGRGAGAARNAGLDVATADRVLFLDDDIVPMPRWVEALVSSMTGHEPAVLFMGYCPFAPIALRSYLDRRNAAWYEAKLRPLRDPGHAWQFTDFFGGNFGADRRALRSLGGFDSRFALFEDAELALRALEAGWRIEFVPEARAEHHAHRGIADYGRQAFRSGEVDALFAQVHPQAGRSLRLGMRRKGVKGLAGDAWRGLNRRTALAVGATQVAARLAERLRLRRTLDLLYSLLWDGEYWRGVAQSPYGLAVESR